MSNAQLLLLLPFIGGLIVAVLAVGAVYLYRWLRDRVQGYPNEEEIEAALLPHIYRAIMFAYKTSESFIDTGQARLRGLDKKLIAGMVYDLMPMGLMVGKFCVNLAWLRLAIPKATFERMVETAFDGFLDWYDDAQAALADKVKEAIGPQPPMPAAE